MMSRIPYVAEGVLKWATRFSLFLLLCVLLLWGRSYYVCDGGVLSHNVNDITRNPIVWISVWSARGEAAGYFSRTHAYDTANPRAEGVMLDSADFSVGPEELPAGKKFPTFMAELLQGSHAGFKFLRYRRVSPRAETSIVQDEGVAEVALPYWAPALAFGILPVVFVLRGFRRWHGRGLRGWDVTPRGAVKWLRRRTVNAVTYASALLCLLSTVLWVRSYWSILWIGQTRTYQEPPYTWQPQSLAIVGWPRGKISLTFSTTAGGPTGLPAGRFTYGGANYSLNTGIAGDATYEGLWTKPPIRALGFSFRREVHVMQQPNGPPAAPPVAHMTEWEAAVPSWIVVLLTGLLPFLRIRATVRRTRASARAGKGLCRVCGYDLRGSPDRCPECGATRQLDRES